MNGRPVQAIGIWIGVSGLLLTACGGGGTDQADGEQADGEQASETILRIGHEYPPEYPVHECGVAPMAEQVNDDIEGLTMETFPSAQLGSQDEMYEQLQAGQIEIMIAGPGFMANEVQELEVFDAAYVFADTDALFEELDNGETAQELFERFRDESGVRVLDMWLYGTRHVAADRPVRTPEDLAGVKMGVADAAIWLDNIQALGATPTPIALGERYLALEQGVISAVEGPAAAIADNSWDEAVTHVSLTTHHQSAIGLMMQDDLWEQLSSDQQEQLEEAAKTFRTDVRECLEEADEQQLAEWKESGAVEIVEDVDIEAFRSNALEHFESQDYPWIDLYTDFAQ